MLFTLDEIFARKRDIWADDRVPMRHTSNRYTMDSDASGNMIFLSISISGVSKPSFDTFDNRVKGGNGYLGKSPVMI